MKFCSACGARVALKIPPGDSLPRHVCDACGTVHYSNPKMVVGAIPEWEDRILLCRRAIEPRYGLWTLPAGFMENGETVGEAATFARPIAPARGIDTVIVNGAVVWREGAASGARPGRVLTRRKENQ